MFKYMYMYTYIEMTRGDPLLPLTILDAESYDGEPGRADFQSPNAAESNHDLAQDLGDVMGGSGNGL